MIYVLGEKDESIAEIGNRRHQLRWEICKMMVKEGRWTEQEAREWMNALLKMEQSQ